MSGQSSARMPQVNHACPSGRTCLRHGNIHGGWGAVTGNDQSKALDHIGLCGAARQNSPRDQPGDRKPEGPRLRVRLPPPSRRPAACLFEGRSSGKEETVAIEVNGSKAGTLLNANRSGAVTLRGSESGSKIVLSGPGGAAVTATISGWIAILLTVLVVVHCIYALGSRPTRLACPHIRCSAGSSTAGSWPRC